MIVEIVASSIYGSMALLTDGWPMRTHVAAFMITQFAYRYARKHANNPAYSFGTGKVNILDGFASAIVLTVVALVTHNPNSIEHYKSLIKDSDKLAHVTIEVNECRDAC